MKKNILIYFPADASYSPRVLAQIDALKNDYNIFLACTKFENDLYESDVEIIIIKKNTMPKSKLVRVLKELLSGDFSIDRKEFPYWNWFQKSRLKQLLKFDFDLVISHNSNSLPICYNLAKKKQIPHIFNAHEYYPRHFESYPKWVRESQPTEIFVCEKYLSKVDHIFCVGEIIGHTYQKNFNCADISFIPNDKPFHNLSPSKIDSPVKIIYHGGCKRARKIEENIEIIKALPKDKFHVDFMLKVYDETYFEELKSLAQGFENINFIPPVSVNDIIPFCNSYDIGLFHISPSTFNLEYCLPNKFFEYIQSRLCLITTPNPEMKALIEKYKIGRVSEDYAPNSTAQVLLNLDTEEIEGYKVNSHKTAHILGSENTYMKMRKVVEDLLTEYS